ncbi:MAG: GIY-YIG nuclease family protein [Candidatus Pacebacteria bacterium]|nr:GIY-YIG nuclease family protein [Candidatus Paceibacterota bacterium]
MFYYIYVLLSKKDGMFYTGYSTDLKGRLEAHQSGRVASTKDRQPCELIYAEACLDKADARHREEYLKTHHGKMFLQNRLKSYLTGSRASKFTNIH